MSSLFPKYFLLLSCHNSKHIQHIDELEKHEDFLVCDEQDIASLHSRFQVDKSRIPGCFHIRCCYNNKYLSVDNNGLIYAGEKQQVEDTEQPNCTLFETKRGDSGKQGAFRLICVKNNQDVNFDLSYYNRSDSKLVLAAATPIIYPHDFTAIDWEALVALPRYVAFKGDNGKYLQVVKNQYLQYIADDRHYKSANFEVFTTPCGRVRVRNNDKFWRAGPNWIYCDSESKDTDYSDPKTLFIPYRIEKNVIALRNIDNNYFCRRTTWDYHDDCLCSDNAGITISREARLEVEEPVTSREVSNFRFREDHSISYNQTRVAMAKAFVSNDTQINQEVKVELDYQYATTHTWTTSNLSSFTAKMGFKFEIPSFIGVSHESSTRKDYSHEWGKRTTVVESKNRTVTVPVKPGRKVKVTVVATRCHCDVPFTYTQEDKHEDGTTLNPEDKDGVYTADYCVDFGDIVEEV